MNTNQLNHQLQLFFKRVFALRRWLFVILVLAAYGFITWRVQVLSTVEPSQATISSQALPQPRIDPTVVSKIKELQDNSVNVQTLFNTARQNPFHE